jgi:Leucine-rich repeat (LRR) protein
MKYNFFALLFLFFKTSLAAQTIIIPDRTFKDFLLENQFINFNYDGEIQTIEAESVTELILNNLKIRDLKGLEYFINLEKLDCRNCFIDTLILDKNTNLKYLICSNNNLKYLDVTNNLNLTYLKCSENKINSLEAV